jgi:hypothetical protein
MKKRVLSVVLTFVMLAGVLQIVPSPIEAEASTSIPTYDQFLAEYNLNDTGFDFHIINVMPYRGYVEHKRNDAAYQALVALWRLATFQSDPIAYHRNQVDFYTAFLFDVLYEDRKMENISGIMYNALEASGASILKTLSDISEIAIESLFQTDIDSLSDLELGFLGGSFGVTKAIGGLTRIYKYGESVEQLVNRLAKVSVLMEKAQETEQILLTMRNNTSSIALREALDRMILILSGQFTEEQLLFLLGSELTLYQMYDFVVDNLKGKVLASLGLPFLIGVESGKFAANFLFSTDAEIEHFFRMNALYEFEDQLRRALITYTTSYRGWPIDARAKTFNSAYRMLLRTQLLGIKASQDYADILYKNGWFEKLLRRTPPVYYSVYTEELAYIQNMIESTMRFADNELHNIYLDTFFPAEKNVLGLTTKPLPHTKEENENLGVQLELTTFLVSDNTIHRNFTLKRDMRTYGSLFLTGGTLDLNGYTLTIEGDLVQTGGRISPNGGRLNVGGDYTITDGTLRMTNANDYVFIGGDFTTRSEEHHSGSLTAGTMELKGDFTQIGTGEVRNAFNQMVTAQRNWNFDASGTHRVIFSGTGVQNISFESTISGFSELEFENSTIRITSRIRGLKLLHDTNRLLFADNILNVSGALDLNGHTLTTNGSLVQAGGTINVNGGRLNITGDLVQTGGEHNINSGRLNVSGDYTITDGTLRMTNANDYVFVGGDFTARSELSHSGRLTAGTMELKGNFTQIGSGEVRNAFNQMTPHQRNWNFDATGTHKVIFSGTGVQNISVQGSHSGFSVLELRNRTPSSIVFTTWVRVSTLFNHNDPTLSNFVLTNGGSFPDYDRDGFRDHLDAYPLCPYRWLLEHGCGDCDDCYDCFIPCDIDCGCKCKGFWECGGPCECEDCHDCGICEDCFIPCDIDCGCECKGFWECGGPCGCEDCHDCGICEDCFIPCDIDCGCECKGFGECGGPCGCEDCLPVLLPCDCGKCVGFGDIDCDGVINSADVTFLRRYVAAENKGAFLQNNPSFSLLNANVTGKSDEDSKGRPIITADDITLLRRYIASPVGNRPALGLSSRS